MIQTDERFPNLRVLTHPLIRHKLARARDKTTPTREFRRLVNEIAGLMTFQLCSDLPLREVEVETPLEVLQGERIARPITLVPVLRAGLGMTDGILAIFSEARVGHIGLFRDEETLEPVSYYTKLPTDLDGGHTILVDPMVATGHSAVKAASVLKEHGCTRLQMVCLVCAPEGVGEMLEHHPDVMLYTAALDRELNENGYILPGLGDAGDRLFGTL